MHVANRAVYAGNVLGECVLLGAGVILGFFAIVRHDLFLGAVATFSGAGGLWLLPQAVRHLRVRVERIEVSSESVTLHLRDSSTRVAYWNQAGVKFRMWDYRTCIVFGMRSRAEVPCGIDLEGVFSGLSLEGLKEVRSRAKSAGLRVVDTPPNPAGRVICIGDWPDARQSFSDSEDYH